jgi:transcriptional regulator with XRE-family HTH domain
MRTVPSKGVPVPGLKEARIGALLTQAELAERAGVDRNTVARLETGDPAALRTVRKLATALSVAPAVLTSAAGGEARPRMEAAA